MLELTILPWAADGLSNRCAKLKKPLKSMAFKNCKRIVIDKCKYHRQSAAGQHEPPEPAALMTAAWRRAALCTKRRCPHTAPPRARRRYAAAGRNGALPH